MFMKAKSIFQSGKWAMAVLLFLALDPQLSTVRAQSSLFTYQGRVIANGTNFTGIGLFKFALVTGTNGSSQATATANLTGTFVTSCTVTYGGSGYTNSVPPAVTFSGGGGSGATATASVSGGAVTTIMVTSAGSGYTSPPTVTIGPPPPSTVFDTYWSNDGTSSAGSEPASAVSVGVSSGLFTVVLGDATASNMTAISASIFTVPNLQLRIWFNDGAHGSAALSPVQNLTQTPYAVTALNLAGVVENNTIAAGQSATVGGGLGNVSSNTYATVGGGYDNFNIGYAASIGGGYYNVSSNDYATVAGGIENNAGGYAATVGGGEINTSSAYYSTTGGGYHNTASGYVATVGGGYQNISSNNYTTVGGGYLNTAGGYGATVAGGYQNSASGSYATVCGGEANIAAGSFSFAGGLGAQALHQGSFVWADDNGGSFASTAQNQFCVRAAGGASSPPTFNLEPAPVTTIT